MPTTLIKLQATMPGTPEVDRPQADRLLRGNPTRETWNLVDEMASGRIYAGVWRCEPGCWRIEMAANERELFTVLAGRCRVHGDDGTVEEVGAGEALWIPAGFRGSFEVLEPLTKTYAIVAD